MLSFLSRASGNSSRIEKALLKVKSRETSVCASREIEIQKEIQKAEAEIRLKHAPLRREEEFVAVEDALESIIQVLEFREVACSCPDSFVGKGRAKDPICIETETETGSSEDPVCISDSDSEASPETTCAKKKAKKKAEQKAPPIKGKKRPDLTWYDRSIGVFLYLHPSIYGQQPTDTMCYNSVAAALGSDGNTVRQWISLKDKGAETYISIWYPIVKDMKWGEVKRRFPQEWCAQYNIPDDGDVSEHLAPFKLVAEKSQTVIVTKGSEGRMANPKARSVEAKKNKNVKNVRLSYGANQHATKRMGRKDSGRPRAYVDQVEAVEEMVQDRWNSGDPTTRMEVYDMLRGRDDCAEGTDFYNSCLDAGKGSQLSMFLSRTLHSCPYQLLHEKEQYRSKDSRELASNVCRKC